MRNASPSMSSTAARTPSRLLMLLALSLVAGATSAVAQSGAVATNPRVSGLDSLVLAAGAELALASTSGTAATPDPEALPEAPTPQISPVKPVNPGGAGPPVAPLRAKYIPAGWRAQPLGFRGKLIVGGADLYSFENFAAMFLSAGYEHVLNSEPNYGTDRGAFGERLGAAAVRETSQGIFTDMVFAPLLHEDPRFYQEGRGHTFAHRTLHAIVRPFVTRTDSGNPTINGSLLLGYAASAALTPAFYPQSNRNFHDAFSVYAGSLGGSALGYFVGEFSTDLLSAVHLKHNQ